MTLLLYFQTSCLPLMTISLFLEATDEKGWGRGRRRALVQLGQDPWRDAFKAFIHSFTKRKVPSVTQTGTPFQFEVDLTHSFLNFHELPN